EAQRGDFRGPLHGVPIAIKDSWATRGLRTTNGFPGTAKFVPDYDATVVARLKAAGAIVVGKSNLSALAMDVQSENPVAGRANHPGDIARTPGGSSGGGACAVAAGLVPFDIGSDIGGSIRLPAHYCGVFGFKPTENAVSLHGHLPGLPEPRYVALRNLASAGPIARSFADLRLAFDLIRGPDPLDPKIAPIQAADAPSGLDATHPSATTPAPGSAKIVRTTDREKQNPTEARPLRVAVLNPAPELPIDAEYERGLRNFTETLRKSHAIDITELERPPFNFHAIGVLWGKLLNAGTAPFTPAPVRLLMAVMNRISKERPAGANQIFPLSFEEFMRVFTERDRAVVNFERWFAGENDTQGISGFDALLAPVSATPAFAHRKPDRVFGATNLYSDPVSISRADGSACALEYYTAHTGYTMPFNLLGNPVVSIPIGETASGLAFGAQVVGPRWSDLRLLDAAERIYRAGTD
ncbi:MAG: amidase, partial [Leptospirales bacterium]